MNVRHLRTFFSSYSFDSSGKITFAVMILILLGAIYLAGGYFRLKYSPVSESISDDSQIIREDNVTDEDALQLRSVNFRVSPPPVANQPPVGGACNHDNGLPINTGEDVSLDNTGCVCTAFLIECRNNRCVDVVLGGIHYGCDSSRFTIGQSNTWDLYCNMPSLTGEGNGIYCVGKPIIYLYPEKETYVDVSIKTDGNIFISDPLYPEGGWKDVLAKPNGDLFYEGKSYRELFYETNARDIRMPQTGLVVEKKLVESTLSRLLDQLGLTEWEKREFLEYWLPRLNDLDKPYLFISFIEPDEKKRIDEVIVTPEPDTRIDFLAFFKPLEHKISVKPLNLPPMPQRKGFVMVEWGGTIDNSNPFAKYLLSIR